VRILGGIICGLLIYYYVPIGLGNGPGPGPGPGGPSVTDKDRKDSDRDKKDAEKDKKDKDKPPDKITPLPVATDALTIEVLGDPDGERIWFRLWDGGRSRLRNVSDADRPKLKELLPLPELKRRVEQRLTQKPPLRRIEVLYYLSTPSPLYWERDKEINLIGWLEKLAPVDVDGHKERPTIEGPTKLDKPPPVE
jgi:hypothetical protein